MDNSGKFIKIGNKIYNINKIHSIECDNFRCSMRKESYNGYNGSSSYENFHAISNPKEYSDMKKIYDKLSGKDM